jgi:hypothetical protein
MGLKIRSAPSARGCASHDGAESLILEVFACRELERSRRVAQGEAQSGRSAKADDLARKAEKAPSTTTAQWIAGLDALHAAAGTRASLIAQFRVARSAV